jgi:hypothetical protein
MLREAICNNVGVLQGSVRQLKMARSNEVFPDVARHPIGIELKTLRIGEAKEGWCRHASVMGWLPPKLGVGIGGLFGNSGLTFLAKPCTEV